MGELIKDNFLSYIFLTVFMGLWVLLVIYGTFKKTKSIESKKIKTVLRFGISGALVCLWAWHFVCMNLYPVSLAYYEYKNDLAVETIGVIESIEQDGKDRIYLIIDNTKYTMVHSSVRPVIIGWDVEVGDAVKIRFGEKSKFVFDICESRTGDGFA